MIAPIACRADVGANGFADGDQNEGALMVTLTDDQYKQFGRITHLYASAESGLKLCLSGMLGVPLTDVFVLTDRLGADSLRKVAKTIAKQRLDNELATSFGHLVGELKSKARLRNFIGHLRWSSGTRPDSIRPAYATGENERLELFGYNPSEDDFTTADLAAAADALDALNGRIVRFLIESGLDEITQAVNHKIVEPIAAPKKTPKGGTASS